MTPMQQSHNNVFKDNLDSEIVGAISNKPSFKRSDTDFNIKNTLPFIAKH